MKAHFNPTIFVTLAVLGCPEVAMAVASMSQTSGTAASATIPASVYSANVSRRAQLTKLFDASFHDPRRRMERCSGTVSSHPPQPYRWTMVERWWETVSGFPPRDQLGPGFNTRVVQNQSFSRYMYCLWHSPH